MNFGKVLEALKRDIKQNFCRGRDIGKKMGIP